MLKVKSKCINAYFINQTRKSLIMLTEEQESKGINDGLTMEEEELFDFLKEHLD
jgi:hypothetical protein